MIDFNNKLFLKKTYNQQNLPLNVLTNGLKAAHIWQLWSDKLLDAATDANWCQLDKAETFKVQGTIAWKCFGNSEEYTH